MAKDPAFLFYPGDWLSGTHGMTFEQKGAYIELLLMQFNRGHMTSHMVGQVVGQIWMEVQNKFIQDDKGLWYNERLDEEKEKRKSFTTSRKNNLKGANQYTKKDKQEVGHMTSHMENENIVLVYNKSKEILNSKIWLDLVSSRQKITYDKTLEYLKEFLNKESVKDDFINKPIGKIKDHFINWLVIKHKKHALPKNL